MSDFRAIPLKKPYEVNVAKPLKNVLSVISSTSSKSSQDYSNQISAFSKLRTSALWKAFERRDGALEELYTYFDQLNALEKKIPAGELQIPFKWRDAFCKGLFTKATLTIPSIGYEKICVLFNMAALQSFVGSTQSLDNDESLKEAAKLFQQSADIFDYLKNNVMSILQREPTPDLHPDTLAVLSYIMLAQAQEVFLLKSLRENMKNDLIAKLCNETCFLYDDAFKAIKQAHVYLWDKDTIPTVSGKQAMFQGMAEYYQSLECKSKKAVGEHIARLKVAVALLRSALKCSNKLTKASETIAVADKVLKDAIKDNECIYHDLVPDRSALSPIERASLVTLQPLPEQFSREFRDIFEELVPAVVKKLLTSFETKKEEIVQSEVFRLQEATQLLNAILASLNLPAAIEDTMECEIPQSLVAKSIYVRNHGGSDAISRMLVRIPDIQIRNTEILEEIEKMLNDEKECDDKLRKEFKEKWTRRSSSRLTLSFRSKIETYRQTISVAIDADKSLRGRFEDHKMYIELLGNGPSAISKALPLATLMSENKESHYVFRLHQIMKQVEDIRVERDVIERELRSINSDMKETFLSTLNKGKSNEDALLEDGLKLIFNPIQQKVKSSLSAQESLIEDIQNTNAQFTIERREQNIAAQEREEVLKKLAVAYDVFIELSNDLEEGSKFYNDLTEILIQIQSKVADFCFARKTEKEELVKNIERSKYRIQEPVSKHNNETLPPTYKPQQSLGATTESSISHQLPYPTVPQYMPMPYGPQIQLPYPQYFMTSTSLPNMYTMPLPTRYQPPQQNPDDQTDNQKPPST